MQETEARRWGRIREYYCEKFEGENGKSLNSEFGMPGAFAMVL